VYPYKITHALSDGSSPILLKPETYVMKFDATAILFYLKKLKVSGDRPRWPKWFRVD